MELHAYTRTISDLFSVNRKYVVPRFQREYSWQKEEIKDLWDDILSNIKRNRDGKFTHEEYFLGALVLIGDDKSPTLEIVDGQQRLTTLTILLSVLCHRFKEIDKQNVAMAIYENYIAGKDDDGEYDYFKLTNETPKPFFQKHIQHHTRESLDPEQKKKLTDEEETLLSAYDLFYEFTSQERLKSSLRSNFFEEEWYEKTLKAVRDQIVKFLKVIFITVSEEEEAYTIFETLNARGMNLSFVDLIKNKLFKSLNQTHPDDTAKTQWNEIRTIISSREVGSLETFVRHWWLSQYSFESRSKLYKKFKNLWNKNQIDAKKFILNLHQDANLYIKISAPSPDDFKRQEEKLVYRSLKAFKIFGITQHRPFLLSLFKARESKKLRLNEIKDILDFLEKFHFKFNAICSLRPSILEKNYSTSAIELMRANGRDDAKLILNDLRQKFIKRNPEESTFIESFSKLRYSNKYTRDKLLIQYIFNYIEYSQQITSEFQPDNLSLEHILPQSHSDDISLERIGNLLPLGLELNQAAGSKSPIDKIKIYKKSQYKMTRDFADSFSGTWDSDAIETRTKELARFCYHEVWNIPQ
ncbi:MAG: DUF262 domain-containing protein [Limnospira sp.]